MGRVVADDVGDAVGSTEAVGVALGRVVADDVGDAAVVGVALGCGREGATFSQAASRWDSSAMPPKPAVAFRNVRLSMVASSIYA